MASEAGVPIYFSRIELENVRCFGATQILELALPDGKLPQWTLLIGDNGVGKTTLLQCLAWMRPSPWKDFSRSEDARGSVRFGGDLTEFDGVEPALMAEENKVLKMLTRGGQGASRLRVRMLKGREIGSTNDATVIDTGIDILAEDGDIKDARRADNSTFDEIIDLPKLNIVAYGANRQMGIENLGSSDLDDAIASRLLDITEMYDAEEILLKLHYAAAIEKSAGPDSDKLQKAKKIIADVLPDIASPDDIEILGPKIFESQGRESGVRFRTHDGPVPLSALSLGYQTTMSWIVDFAWRQFERFPDSPDPLAEPAIVLIDEIDLHLHPLWQRTIIDSLTPLFRRTQFIATSHSPLVVQSLKSDANIIALTRGENQDVRIVSDPRDVQGWRVDQILTSLFGVPSGRGVKFESLILERDSLLDKLDRTPEEECRLKDIEAELESLPVAELQADQKALDFIRRAAESLGQH